jgi:hypothetical protein
MKGWRTIGLNLALTMFGFLEATDWTAVLGSDRAGWVVTGVGITNMVLRSMTTTRVGRPT